MTDKDDALARLAGPLEQIARIAAGDYAVRGHIVGDDELIDGLTIGLDLLAENFEAEREQRLEAEHLLRDAEDAYNHAPGLFCSVNATNHRIVKANNTLASKMQRAAAAVVGSRFEHLFVRSDAAAIRSALAALVNDEPLPARTYQLGGGERAPIVEMSGSRVLDDSGQCVRIRVILRDVTVEKELQEQLIHAQKIEAVGQLAGGLAHELNNILTVIQGGISFIRMDAAAVPGIMADVVDIEDAARRATELTSQLLTLSRRIPIQPQAIDIVQVLRKAERMLSRTLGETVKVTFSWSSDIAAPRLGNGQLEQLLMNLATNARDAMGGAGAIDISAHNGVGDASGTVVIEVKDNGPGMTEEQKARLFEPFYTTKAHGHGLGLAVCESIVQYVGGQIGVVSSPGAGCTIRMSLPIARERAPRRKTTTASVPEGHERILVVEDDALVRRIIVRILEGAGYDVVAAEDGTSARAAFNRDFDLIVTDVVMPGESGTTLAIWAREQAPDLPVLFMTGYAPDGLPTETMGGAVGVVSKPFEAADLLRIVRDTLEQRGPLSGAKAMPY